MARQKTDLSAALTGFVLGAVSLFLILTTIVILTNARYRNREAAAGAAATPAASSTAGSTASPAQASTTAKR